MLLCNCRGQRFLLFVTFLMLAQTVVGQTEPAQPPAADAAPGDADQETHPDALWAKLYLKNDPLAALQQVTLEDLRRALEDSQLQSIVISNHFSRVTGATEDEKIAFLANAMRSSNVKVQRQAAVELHALKALESVVRDLLLEYLQGEDRALRGAAIVGLELIEVPADEQSDVYWRRLVDALDESDESVSRAAERQLKDHGAHAVPSLLDALANAHPQRLVVARLLSEIVGSKAIPTKAMYSVPAPESLDDRPESRADSPSSPRLTVGKSAAVAQPTHSVRDVDPTEPKSVTVYFGTNRELIDRPRRPWSQVLQYPLLALLLLAALVPFFTGIPSDTTTTAGTIQARGCGRWLLPVMLVFGAGWAMLMFRSELQQHWQLRSGASFGPRRDPAETVHYGTCTVSIPPRHQVGVVERPLIGPENEQDHVVLKEVEKLAEDAFFDLVKSRIAELPKDNRSCFVFIHGFNVDFDSAARRTAQMHYDLKFESVPIFFSWPSRANLRHYFSDRNEIEFSRYVIKEFLLNVAERVKADRIHVIAHSMGADATCRAIADLGDRGKIFDQIILAAPDIDSEVFRVQIAPRMTKTANRTTMYCSKNDWALMLSRNFNDSTRAGDSSDGALVLQGVDTIDASEIDTDLLGHSYYGDCLPILDDVNLLMRSSLPPLERRLRPWPVDEQLLYWTLPEDVP
jgi:esterase/lipase superfamily enzyme